MDIDLTKILTGRISTLNINNEVKIPESLLSNSLIDNLENIMLIGKIYYDEEDNLVLTGNINGIMVLKDDITLEPVKHKFDTEIEEILDKNQNILDITEILWQNILVEIPSKVRATDEDIELSGDGWRVISEEKYIEERKEANNPFANLNELLKTKEDKQHGSSIQKNQ